MGKESRLPGRERAQQVVDSIRAGMSYEEICKEMRAYKGHNIRAVIDLVFEEPDRFDTYIDEVAVERAFRGDRTIWDTMTYYEKAAVIDLITERAVAGRNNPGFPGDPAMSAAGLGDGWVRNLGKQLGEPPDRFRRIIDKRISPDRIASRGKGPGSGSVNASKTECKRGHPFNDVNTRIAPDGRRQCRACVRVCRAAKVAKQRAEQT